MSNTRKIAGALFVMLMIFFNQTSIANPTPDSNQKSIFDKLSYQDILDIDLIFDMETVVNNRRSDDDYQAILKFKDQEGIQQKWDIEVSVRGKFRRLKCDELPPLKLKFKKKHLEASGLATFNDMKLVAYCKDDSEAAKAFLLKEFLAYRLYNQLTDNSFRVQLININFHDISKGTSKTQLGFIIEDTAQLRSRLGAKKQKQKIVNEIQRFNESDRKRVALFQYMIGNTDWDMTKSKNIKLVRKDSIIIPIPYDFDFSALVSANYALLPSTFGQERLRDRVLLGFEEDANELGETIQLFKDKKSFILKTIRSFKKLDSAYKDDMIHYVKTFYNSLDKINWKSNYRVALQNK